MDTRQQKNKKVSSDEWYTPKWIIDRLGPFSLDPCSPAIRPFDTAIRHFTKDEDGLIQPWKGRIWLNPPYSHPLLEQFIKKMAEHNNGIALLVNRQDNVIWQEVIFPTAASMIFMRHRVKFIHPEGKKSSPFTGSCLVAWGQKNDDILRNCGIEGKYVCLNTHISLNAVPDTPEAFILSRSASAGSLNTQQAVVSVSDAYSALKMKEFEIQNKLFHRRMSTLINDFSKTVEQ